MQRAHSNWERRVADSFFNLGETGANEPEVISLQSQLYIKYIIPLRLAAAADDVFVAA